MSNIADKNPIQSMEKLNNFKLGLITKDEFTLKTFDENFSIILFENGEPEGELDLLIIDSDCMSIENFIKLKQKYKVILLAYSDYILKVIDFIDDFIPKPVNISLIKAIILKSYKAKKNIKEDLFQSIHQSLSLAYYKGIPTDRERISNYYIGFASIVNFLNKCLLTNVTPKESQQFFDLTLKLLDKKIKINNNLNFFYFSQETLSSLTFIIIGWLIQLEDNKNIKEDLYVNIWNNINAFKMEVNDLSINSRFTHLSQLWLEKVKPFLNTNPIPKIQIELNKFVS